MLAITPAQKISLTFIHEFTMANNYPPSIQEIASDRGVACNASQELVVALCKKGFITKEAGKARSLVITEKGKIQLESV